jgi:hypothetical protein
MECCVEAVVSSLPLLQVTTHLWFSQAKSNKQNIISQTTHQSWTSYHVEVALLNRIHSMYRRTKQSSRTIDKMTLKQLWADRKSTSFSHTGKVRTTQWNRAKVCRMWRIRSFRMRRITYMWRILQVMQHR